jgi:transposase InsO family protein
MPWKECVALDQRIEFVILARAQVQSFATLCRQFGISRKTGYKWLRRYAEADSFSVLANQSRRPRRSPERTDAIIEARVVQLRRELGWGVRKLQVLLIREGIILGEATINRIIKRNGLIRREGAHRPALKHFEREQPNELWQIDFKGHVTLEDGRRCYPLSILDDHSRFLVGLFALPSLRVGPTLGALREAFVGYGLPETILTDRGTPFWSPTNARGLTQVSVEMLNQGIKITHGAVRHPQTQGKVERFHRTLQEAMRHEGTPRTLTACRAMFDAFRGRYNQERPHEALAMAVPATRYQHSDRVYRSEPVPWEYPAGMEVVRLNAQGCLDDGGQRLFVCEALANQWVGTLHVEGKLLIQFRDMLMREVQLDGRKGVAFTH